MRGDSDEVDDSDDLRDEDFASLNGNFSSLSDFKVMSGALRDRFKRLGKSQKHIIAVDWFEDQFYIKWKVAEHYHALKRNVDNRFRKNDYGAVIEDSRSEEIMVFLDSVDFPQKAMSNRDAVKTVLDTLHTLTLSMGSSGFDPSSIPTNGFEFEDWVASNLSKFGWNAKSTKGSGDQGVDVIATKNGIKVGVQCKLYSSNVGNKAVQEINAGRTFFKLDKVAVLTNAGYTKSARELAETCDVSLLSQYDIPRFDALFLKN